MMAIMNMGARRLALAAALAALSGTLHGASTFAALERAALTLKAPERQVLQAAAQAGASIVAVGERGIVVLSDDAGQTWRQARSVPVSTTLTAVSFADARNGWAVGHGGVVLHTRDGGETWLKQADGALLAQLALQSAQEAMRLRPDSAAALRAFNDAKVLLADGPDKPLLDVHFQDARHGWVVGAYNLFFETMDGGASWKSVSERLDNPKGLHLYALRSQGKSVFIVGEQGQMHRSLDGGQSFEALASPYKGSWFALALGADGSLVAAGLRGNVFYSPDQGANWRPVEGAPPASFVSASPLKGGSVLLANQGGQLFTSHGGAALQALPAPPMRSPSGMLVLKDQRLLVLGFGGAVRLPAPGENGIPK